MASFRNDSHLLTGEPWHPTRPQTDTLVLMKRLSAALIGAGGFARADYI
jgi:hypothetical protein